MIVLRDDVVFDNPQSRIREYCEIEIYRGYDNKHSIDNSISQEDVNAANGLSAMIDKIDKHESKRLLIQSRNNSKILESQKLKPFFVFHENQLVLDNSFLNHPTYKWKTGLFWSNLRYFYRYSRILQLFTKLKDLNSSAVQNDNLNNQLRFEYLYHNIFFPPTDYDWQQAWSITESLLMMIRDEVEKHNARFVLITLSNDIKVHPDPEYRKRFMKYYGINDLLYPDKRIKLLGKKENIELLLLAPVFQEYAQKNHVFLHGVLNSEPSGLGHWNINAHRLAGEIIAEYLCSDGSL